MRGQIAVEAPGAEDEWFVGVFGEVITFITGAAPKTGFIGAEFGQTDNIFVRQNKMVYSEEPTGQLPPMREWIFTRLDSGARVGVKFNLVIILPIPTPGRVAMGKTMAAGEATPEEAADCYEYWNDSATIWAWFISAETIFTNLCHAEVPRSIPLNETVGFFAPKTTLRPVLSLPKE